MHSSTHTGVRGLLLDIEGTTSSISFVHDVMFPYVLLQLDTFLASELERPDVRAGCEQMAIDAGYPTLALWSAAVPQQPLSQLIAGEVRRLMASDVKATGLKALQGLIWAGGFHSGQLVAHVYPDVLPAIERWRAAGLDVRIYSSGSIAAQRLFFGHVAEAGDCLHLFTGHYDTTIGSKKEADSYRRIAEHWGLLPAEIMFVSDIAAELRAAQAAGLQTCASVRPGNAALPADFDLPCVTSLDAIAV
jgi:enolase-phosphatase E1